MPYFKYDRIQIPNGEPGTKATVQHIVKEIRKGTQDELIRRHALKAVSGCKSKDKLCEMKSIFRYLKKNYTFRNDPVDVELIHTAEKLAQLMTGDCDDAVILAGSILRSVGIPVRIVVISHMDHAKDAFSHIYLQAQNPYTSRWYGFDVSVPSARFGWEPPKFFRKVFVDILPNQIRWNEYTPQKRTG